MLLRLVFSLFVDGLGFGASFAAWHSMEFFLSLSKHIGKFRVLGRMKGIMWPHLVLMAWDMFVAIGCM